MKLGKEDADAIERDETRSVEAFEAYSRGVLNLRSAGREAMDRAISLFERAITLDPTYATAWSALGGALYLKGQFLGMRELAQKAMEHLRRAIELHPGLANAHVWLGSVLLQLGEIDQGIAELKTAQELEPENPDVHQTLARAFWLFRGMVPEGIAELRRSIALNPEGGYSHLQLSMLEALSGNLDEAEVAARHAIELQERAMSGTEGLLIVGAHARLGYVHYLRGNYDSAYVEYRRELEYLTSSDHALRERTLIELHQKLSALQRARGDQEGADRFGDMAIDAHERRIAGGADDPATRYYMAALYAGRGDLEHTREHLALPLAGNGYGPDVLHGDNPKLIIVRVSGWGQDGPYRDKPGFGSLVEGMSGFAAKNGYPDRPPVLPPLALADMVAGLYGANAVLIALREIEQHGGKGQVIDLPLLDPIFSVLGPEAAIYQLTQKIEPRVGSRSHNTAPRNVYETKRRPLHLDLGLDPDHGGAAVPRDRPRRHDRRSALPHQHGPRAQHRRMRPAGRGFHQGAHAAEGLAIFEAAEVTAAPVYDIDQFIADPHVQAREIVTELPDDEMGSVPMHAVVPRLSGTPGEIRMPAPALGEHNNEILGGLGVERRRHRRSAQQEGE